MIDTNLTLADLTERAKIELSIDPSQAVRLKSQFTNKYFTKEELDRKLNCYKEFNEGGARLQVDEGEPPSQVELIVKVCLYSKADVVYDFYANAESSVKDLKLKVCEKLLSPEQKPEDFTLYRANHFDEPQFPLRREGVKIPKASISSGDLLILKENSLITPEDKLLLFIHVTMTGLPEDSQFVSQLAVTKDFTVQEVKESILEMDQFSNYKDIETSRLRIRTKQQNMYFGEIYKKDDLTLKQAQIRPNQPIVCQFLEAPEQMKENQMLLLLSKREGRKYVERQEFLFEFDTKEPTLQELTAKIQNFLGAKVALSLYIPHQFEWVYLDPEHEVEEKKGKKNKQIVKHKLKDFSLKKFPYNLRDGCVIGYKLLEEGSELEGEDWQTEEDKEAKARYYAQKEEERKQKQADGASARR